MKRHRVLAGILSSLMLVALTTACSNGSNTSGSTSSNSDGSSENQISTNNTGRLGKIVIYQNCGKVQSAGKPGSNEQDFKDVEKYIEDATNIDIEVVVPPTGEEDNKLNMMLAAQENIDLFWGEWTKYASKGAIQSLTKSLKENGSAIVSAWGEDAMSQMTDSSGEIWGVPRLSPLVVYPIYVRTDWLKAIGKEAPKTIDELEEVLKLFKEKDVAGGGNTVGLLTTKSVNNVMELDMCLAAGFTGKGFGYYLDSDGKVKPSVLDPKYKDFIQRMSEWYAKGYIYKEAFATDKNTAREMIKKGNVGVSAMWYSTVTMQAPYLTQNNPEATYTLCAPLEGPAGKCETTSAKAAKGALVPAYSKNVDLVIKYLNWNFEDVENHIVAENGLKDVHWKYTDEANHIIQLTSENYIGEFVAGQGIANEKKYSFSDPIKKLHYDYLQKEIINVDRAVVTNVADTIFDTAAISTAVVNYEDINRMTEEEIAKFITGVRPMSEYDSFINDLNSIGTDKLIEELTRQYNESKK